MYKPLKPLILRTVYDLDYIPYKKGDNEQSCKSFNLLALNIRNQLDLIHQKSKEEVHFPQMEELVNQAYEILTFKK